MELIRITDKFVTLHDNPYKDITLLKDNTYLLNEVQANSIASLGLGQLIDGFDQLPHFDQEDLGSFPTPQKVLFLFERVLLECDKYMKYLFFLLLYPVLRNDHRRR